MKAKTFGLADLNALQKQLKIEIQAAEAAKVEDKKRREAQGLMQSEFLSAVKNVTPIASKNQVVHGPRNVKLPEVKRMIAVKPPIKDRLSDGFDARHLRDDELGIYLRKGAPESLLKKLQKGEWAIDLRLDLHGKTAEEARIATSAFLYGAVSNGARVISIIHGQGFGSSTGKGILKAHVRNWLVQNQHILAFCAAPSSAGGHGAVLVLLHKAEPIERTR